MTSLSNQQNLKIFNQTEKKFKLLLITMLPALVASLLTIFIMRQVCANTPRATKPVFNKHCGNSTSEAQELGCTFDPLTISWLPAACARDMVQEFIDFAGPEKWHYWLDSDGKEEIQDYNALSRIDWYWTTNREHLSHCVFIIMRLHRAVERGEQTDVLTMSYHHTEHCLMFLLEYASTHQYFNSIATNGNVRFGSC